MRSPEKADEDQIDGDIAKLRAAKEAME